MPTCLPAVGALIACSTLLIMASPVMAADPGPQVALAALDDDAGWEIHKEDAQGVAVYKKTIAGLPVPGFKGVKIITADPDELFNLIINFRHHVGMSDDIPLDASWVLAEGPGWIDFYQYLDMPGWTLANDRYWIARARISRDIGGVRGHHKETWEKIDAARYPKATADAMARDDDAVLTPLNYGSWEVVPLGGGKVKLIYRVLSDPGGSLPKAAVALATGKTLPDNLLQFEAAMKR